MEVIAVTKHQGPMGHTAQRVRLLQYRVEHRGKIAWRRIDDLQYFGGRGLLLQCLARFGQQPRILHRDHRLRRKVLQQRDLLVGEGVHLLTENDDGAEQGAVLTQRHRDECAGAGEVGNRAPIRIARAV